MSIASLSEIDDTIVRPLRLDDFAGQSNLKEQLKIYCESAKRRNDVLEHVLLSGLPGLGKTTLAHIIANEMNSRIVTTSGAVLEHAKDIVNIVIGLKRGDILFIDEIHRMNHMLEELLYPAMEDFKMDVIVGEEGSVRACQIQLNKFTLIGATTKNISMPLHGRFNIHAKLELYSVPELIDVINRSASIMGITISPDGVFEIARRSRGTPRIANRLLRRVRDYAMVKENERSGNINKEITNSALMMLGIDNMGLDNTDRKILELLSNSKKPVGLKVMSSIIGEGVEIIEEVQEPYLLQIGFIEIAKSGRLITQKGIEHLNS